MNYDYNINDKLLNQLYLDKHIIDEYSNKTILIEIPAYAELLLLHTILGAVAQADFPNRLHFAVCYQDDDLETLAKLRLFPNMKITHVSIVDSSGLCSARLACQELLSHEDYVLHIDSHMMFNKHWDTMLIHDFEKYNRDDVIFSARPPATTKFELDDCMYDDPKIDNVIAYGCAIGARDRNESGKPWSFKTISYKTKQDRLGLFISGGFLFGKAVIDKTVLSDPGMCFLGDELPMSARYFTHGFHVIHPKSVYVYHRYYARGLKKPGADWINRDKHANLKKSERERALNLFRVNDNIDLGGYGLGSNRPFDEFLEISGLDFVNWINNKPDAYYYFGDDLSMKNYRE